MTETEYLELTTCTGWKEMSSHLKTRIEELKDVLYANTLKDDADFTECKRMAIEIKECGEMLNLPRSLFENDKKK